MNFCRKHKGDHGYATLSECRSLDQESTSITSLKNIGSSESTDNNQNTDKKNHRDSEENQNNTNKDNECVNNDINQSKDDVKNVNASQADDLRVQVSHEHSYGTKRDSSPETDQVFRVICPAVEEKSRDYLIINSFFY